MVAYFTENRAVLGNNQFTHQWQGVTWQFVSAANRDKFAQNPQQYAPQYGGYCAKAAAEGNLAKTNPDAFKIVDGKLYLNYDKSVQAEWNRNIPSNIVAANKNWDKILTNRELYE